MDDIIPFLALGLLFLCVFLLYQDRRIVHWKREAEEYRKWMHFWQDHVRQLEPHIELQQKAILYLLDLDETDATLEIRVKKGKSK
jgi:hypothetical protein